MKKINNVTGEIRAGFAEMIQGSSQIEHEMQELAEIIRRTIDRINVFILLYFSFSAQKMVSRIFIGG